MSTLEELKPIKVVIVGDSNCEKTEFTTKIIGDMSNTDQITIGVEFQNKKVTVNDKTFTIQLWNTAGQERFRSVSKAYYRNARAAFILYNPAIKSTFDSLPNCLKDLREFSDPNISIMLIGHKLKPEDPILISQTEAESFAQQEHLLHREISMFEETNYDEIIYDLVKTIAPSINNTNQPEPKKKSIFSFFKRNNDDKKSEVPKPQETKINKNEISISSQNFDKIVSHVRFIENHLNMYEDVQPFNFNTYKMDQIIKKKNASENIFIDDEIEESFHVVLEELKEDELYQEFKIIDRRNCLVMLKKILKTEERIQFKDLQNTIKEFDVLNKINHPCICKIYGINLNEKVGNDLTTVALFLEFNDYDLSTFLDQKILSNSMKVKIAIEIAFGMSYIHKIGMIHRDLSIKNIKLNQKFEAKICNFGQAHLHESIQNETIIEMTKNIGDFVFMSPEMQNDDDDADYDNKTDVYSFGVILYKMFSGDFPKITISDIINKVSPKFPSSSPFISDCCIELIKMCMSYDPIQRPSFDQILDYMQKNSFSLTEKVDVEMITQRFEALNKLNKNFYLRFVYF